MLKTTVKSKPVPVIQMAYFVAPDCLYQGEKVFVEAWPVAKVIDTTAAGDFYAAGVMYGLMNGSTLTQCAKVGTILSGHVIQIVGTQLASEAWNQIKSLIAETTAL